MNQAQREKSPTKSTVVGIALVRRGDEFLVRRRPEGTALAGYWEFPGGKAMEGETPSAATVRECREELGVDVELLALRTVISHEYRHGLVELHFFDAFTTPEDVSVDPETGFRWVSQAELRGLAFPEANAPVIAALTGEAAPGS